MSELKIDIQIKLKWIRNQTIYTSLYKYIIVVRAGEDGKTNEIICNLNDTQKNEHITMRLLHAHLSNIQILRQN